MVAFDESIKRTKPPSLFCLYSHTSNIIQTEAKMTFSGKAINDSKNEPLIYSHKINYANIETFAIYYKSFIEFSIL